MNPRQFEELVCEYFRKQGYKAETTSYSGDFGVDVFASNGKEKLAIQVKMYGGSTRKINRQMIMELHGAKDYFDCTKAILATDGIVMDDAKEVASKLKIEIMYFDGKDTTEDKLSAIPDLSTPIIEIIKANTTFDSIWETYIMPLQGQTLTRGDGKSNKIMKVDWSGIDRLTSKNNKGKIKIEIFKLAVNTILSKGSITRDEINQYYPGRASSGVVLILSMVPLFQLTNKPIGLKLMKKIIYCNP